MPTTNNPNSQKKKLLDNNSMMRYASMGSQILITIALFTVGGYKLDQWLHLKIPIFTILLSLSGVALGIYFAVRDLLKK